MIAWKQLKEKERMRQSLLQKSNGTNDAANGSPQMKLDICVEFLKMKKKNSQIIPFKLSIKKYKKFSIIQIGALTFVYIMYAVYDTVQKSKPNEQVDNERKKRNLKFNEKYE